MMSYYHEFEPFVEEFMEYGLGYGLFANAWSSLLGIAAYVLSALALFTLAKRRGIRHAWLSWMPVLNCWIVGCLSDQYRYVVKGEVKNKRKTLLILNIISAVIALAIIVVAVVMAVSAIQSAVGPYDQEQLGSLLMSLGTLLVLCLPLAGVTIATKIVYYMALYDVYTSCSPQNNVLYLVLSIVFSITEPFFLFFSRKLDGGMPPRRQPQYEPAQQTWDVQ